MTSQRQFIKGCECGIVLDANTFCNILGLRRVYVLHIAAMCNLISVCALTEILVRIFVVLALNARIIYFSAESEKEKSPRPFK